MTKSKSLVGIAAEFRKTVTETDLVLFAGLTGDFDPLHIDEEYASKTAYGRRLVHGALVVSFMMTAASLAAQQRKDLVLPSVGLDRLRHTGPTFIGDTLAANYVIAREDTERQRGFSDIVVRNQRGETVAVGTHIFKIMVL
jgi:acyl dehydratase